MSWCSYPALATAREPAVLFDDLGERQAGHHAGDGEGELEDDLSTFHDHDPAS